MAPEGVQILRLAEAVVLDQPLVVGRVVGHHERRRRVEPVDQQPQLVVQRRVGRPAETVDVLIVEPLPHGVEQPVGGFLIVDAVEESEESSAIVVMGDVSLVENRGDPPADLAVAIGQEGLARVPIVERVLPIVDHLLLAAPQRRDPVGIVAVERPRKVEKLFFLPGSCDPLND